MSIYIHNFSTLQFLGDQPFEILNKMQSPLFLTKEDNFSLISKNITPVRRVKLNLPSIQDHFDLPKKYFSRNNQILLHCYLQLQSVIEEAKTKWGSHRVGLVIGTSTSGISESEKALQIKNDQVFFHQDYSYETQEIGNASEFLALISGLEGIAYTVSTACSSSSNVFSEAQNLLNSQACDAVLCGGVDSLCQLTLNGFDALEAISYSLTNPMSKNRNGINIGEGGALFLLSKNEAPLKLMGAGSSSDAYHISSPDPEGKGAEEAIKMALMQAQIEPNDVGYINLHGTGTQKNDLMESHLTHRLFGEKPPVSSTKPYHGHTLGAAGAIELAICCSLLLDSKEDHFLPLHLWDKIKDESLAPLNLILDSVKLKKPICMSNNFAFGGNNTSLIVGRTKDI